MSIDIEKNIEFLFRNMEDEIKERNRKRAEIWALKSFRDRSSYLFGVSAHRATECFESQHALNAKTWKWGNASPVKEIIAQISGFVKTLDYSSLTFNRMIHSVSRPQYPM
ncbi:hypothetical protein FMM80_01775 [Schaedlerella arabinosiphila]|uniref:Uncharacterized protein n=1 Tax=Schaedlerella arabinosiphila TaxID=2044587 RepID=A0A9X5C9Q9_9FIRM|nr:hypothetical protein [Schaedlerella arabinosiphila]NBJ03502.1 hypothetical protein [Lachnospiraceae bacterium]NDO67521.1 hypothetical protein [Schaedlerella arabinosiphila]